MKKKVEMLNSDIWSAKLAYWILVLKVAIMFVFTIDGDRYYIWQFVGLEQNYLKKNSNQATDFQTIVEFHCRLKDLNAVKPKMMLLRVSYIFKNLNNLMFAMVKHTISRFSWNPKNFIDFPIIPVYVDAQSVLSTKA